MYAKSQVEIGEDKKFSPDSLPKLTEDQRDQCEGRINQGECIEVLKEMKLNKSPGNDGLSVEFYVTFWQVIGDLVLAAFNRTILLQLKNYPLLRNRQLLHLYIRTVKTQC